MAADTGHNIASAVGSLFRLGAGLMTSTSENRTMRAISQQLLTGPTAQEPTFGTILISIGPVGVPEDVEVINISSLARESKRDEHYITDRLLADGNLLFTTRAFFSLINRLTDEILKGRLSLPIPVKRVREIQGMPLLLLGSKSEG